MVESGQLASLYEVMFGKTSWHAAYVETQNPLYTASQITGVS